MDHIEGPFQVSYTSIPSLSQDKEFHQAHSWSFLFLLFQAFPPLPAFGTLMEMQARVLTSVLSKI